MVKKVRFGLEVGEQRSIRNASFFRYACRWRTQSLHDDDARRRLQDRASLHIASRPRHVLSV